MHFTRLDFVLLRSAVGLLAVLAVTLSSWWPEASVSSAAEMPIGATLKVLAGPVEVQAAQTQTFGAALDGQMLSQGDVVRTGPGGLALLTFFDGSESQLGAESTVQIERAEATPAPQIALLQTAGVTMNHVVPMPPGGTFQTDTPVATGLVRGTSYVVVVGEEPAASQPSWPFQTVLTCGPNGDRSCATSVILLTDRDGHVGRVDVAAAGSGAAADGSAATAPVRLARAGDAAASDAGQTNAAHLAAEHLEALEAGANARQMPDAARDAEHHAHVVAAALARLTTPAMPNGDPDERDALEPAALHAHDPQHVAPVSVSAATAVQPGTGEKKLDNEQTGQIGQIGQTGQTGQSGQSAVSVPAPPPAAPFSRIVPAPPAVSVPAAPAAKPDKPLKP